MGLLHARTDASATGLSLNECPLVRELVLSTDRRTDRRTDGIAVANTALCIASNAAAL